jgi:lysophospholipase L1-like esterase
MFRSKSRGRSIFSSRYRQRRPQFTLMWAIVSLMLALLVAELLTRILVDISGKRTEFARAATELDSIEAYQLKFVNEKLQPYKTSGREGALVAKHSVSVGYQLVENQQHKYWQINERGFRDRDPVPLAKPQDEIRIFLLGGSTAFGHGTPSDRSTIGEYLEARLQQRLQQQQGSPQQYRSESLPQEPDKLKAALAKPLKIKEGKYRVINAAVPGYSSGNELAQLALQIVNYKPDLIIVLNGYSDLMLDAGEQATEIPQLEAYGGDTPTDVKSYISQVIQPLEDTSYLAQIAREHWLNSDRASDKTNFILSESPENLTQYLPTDTAELQRRVDRFAQNHQQMMRIAAGAKIPLIIAMQPEITGRDPSKLTPREGAIATQLGRGYIRQVKKLYPEFVEANKALEQSFPHNIKAVNLYNLSDKYPSPSFIDAIHLNEKANQQVAEQLYYAIASFPKMQVNPPAVESQKSKVVGAKDTKARTEVRN